MYLKINESCIKVTLDFQSQIKITLYFLSYTPYTQKKSKQNNSRRKKELTKRLKQQMIEIEKNSQHLVRHVKKNLP